MNDPKKAKPIEDVRKLNLPFVFIPVVFVGWVLAMSVFGKILNAHDLRRSGLQHGTRGGLSRSVAMQLTRHKTEAVYRRYAITGEADLREGIERLNGVAGNHRQGRAGVAGL